MSDVSEYWSRHLAAIETERITTKAYAEREGLSVAALYHLPSKWRHCADHARRLYADP
ncbi:hypothetical protein [Aromatoleum bremense]|uniref:hypothetical protein n=1 Tax=Aromatoleum bremense TaxID=76115 RepID=UPI001BB7D4E0|nr:hypothetical protein [Aromatoleum bremense]QTQ30901.1 Uncharacterized protein pbN1_09090 [Aromatoleum bremense]